MSRAQQIGGAPKGLARRMRSHDFMKRLLLDVGILRVPRPGGDRRPAPREALAYGY